MEAINGSSEPIEVTNFDENKVIKLPFNQDEQVAPDEGILTSNRSNLAPKIKVNPVEFGSSGKAWREVKDILTAGIDTGVYPGAVLEVAIGGNPIFSEAIGNRNSNLVDGDSVSPMEKTTVFDIAELTSSVVTTSLIISLVQTGQLSLDDPLIRYFQGFGANNKAPITVRQLLNHTSGLAPWFPYFEAIEQANHDSREGVLASSGARDMIYTHIVRASVSSTPGTKRVKSDLGFILLGLLVETLTGLSFDNAAQRLFLKPFGLRGSSFIDTAKIRRRGLQIVKELIAPTINCVWRKRVLCGEAHDENAWAMGGVAGHSGLFSCAHDLTHYCAELLRCYHGRSELLDSEIVKEFISSTDGDNILNQIESDPYAKCFLGWENIQSDKSMLSSGLSNKAFGNTSKTGCSVWVEPEQDLSIVFLSNSIHVNTFKRSESSKFKSFLPTLHKAVLNAACS